MFIESKNGRDYFMCDICNKPFSAKFGRYFDLKGKRYCNVCIKKKTPSQKHN